MSEEEKEADRKDVAGKDPAADDIAKASEKKVKKKQKEKKDAPTDSKKKTDAIKSEGKASPPPKKEDAPADSIKKTDAIKSEGKASPAPKKEDAPTDPIKKTDAIKSEGKASPPPKKEEVKHVGIDDSIFEQEGAVVTIDGVTFKPDEMTELDIKNIEKKRDRLNAKAEDHKYKRDRLNNRTRFLIKDRERLNNKIRKLVKEAGECKEDRNNLNTKVQDAKALRETLNKKANELNEQVNQLKRERIPKEDGPSIGRLKKELRDHEFKQQTSTLSPTAERELVDKMKKLSEEIKEKEKKLEANEDVKQAVRDARMARQEAEAQHQLVSELAENAQKKHERMVEFYSQSDSFRKELNKIHEQLVQTKAEADEEHRMHITLIRQVHDFDKLIFGMRRKIRKARRARGDTDVKKHQKEIMDKFKKGEKLSTEDLLALQNK